MTGFRRSSEIKARSLMPFSGGKMKKRRFQRAAIAILGAAAVLVLGVMANLFLIGEPIDCRQLSYSTALNGQNIDLHVMPVESVAALRGWKTRQDGNTLFISGRKVLASPLFNKGSYETSIDIKTIDCIYLGGQEIWQSGQENDNDTDRGMGGNPVVLIRDASYGKANL